jgi:hypothetical protein
MKTFLDLVLAGEARQDDIDDFVEQWHDGDASCSLAEFLGMSDDEYALWVGLRHRRPAGGQGAAGSSDVTGHRYPRPYLRSFINY